MDSSRQFKVELTQECRDEFREIYTYISEQLKNTIAANQLTVKMKEKILSLTEQPERYQKIGKINFSRKRYHKLIVGNFIVLYLVDKLNKKVYVSRIIYGKRNYFN